MNPEAALVGGSMAATALGFVALVYYAIQGARKREIERRAREEAAILLVIAAIVVVAALIVVFVLAAGIVGWVTAASEVLQ